MANWTKKLGKVASDELEAGEELRSAVFLQPAGTTTKMVARGVGGVVGGALAARSGGTATELVTDSGRAATMPDAATVLGLTDRRLLVYGHSSLSGKPKGLKLTMPVDDLAGVDVEKQKATFKFVIHFVDGSASVYEAPRVSNDPAGFADAVTAR